FICGARGPELESRALCGAVAQLGERRVRNAKVEGSIPFRSTISYFFEDCPDACASRYRRVACGRRRDGWRDPRRARATPARPSLPNERRAAWGPHSTAVQK